MAGGVIGRPPGERFDADGEHLAHRAVGVDAAVLAVEQRDAFGQLFEHGEQHAQLVGGLGGEAIAQALGGAFDADVAHHHHVRGVALPDHRRRHHLHPNDRIVADPEPPLDVGARVGARRELVGGAIFFGHELAERATNQRGARHHRELLGLGVDEAHLVAGENHHRQRKTVEHLLQAVRLGLFFHSRQSQLELIDDEGGEISQHLALQRGEVARLAIDETQGADAVAARGGEWSPGVEAECWARR